ncbi:MAG: dihydroorotate dehydrogenase electron transfer subunit [Dehalococcoidales bacterium]|nr:dihydroorotate dehydrogenase electron transfer subunit [Dehalococcoidales bacterium]
MNNKTQAITVPLESMEELYQGVFLAWIGSKQIARTAQPGQFVMVSCNNYLLRRPLAVHKVSPKKDRFAILFAVCGKGTTWLSRQKPGIELNILGPLGNSFTLVPGAQNILLVAGGLGIAPLQFAAQVAREKGKSVTLLQGASTASCVYPSTSLPDGVKCYTATEDGSCGAHCLVTGILHDYIGWADQIMACGPNAMYHPIATSNKQLFKVKPFQVSLETRMGCGFGACYGCSIKTARGMKKVCHDGPVFDYYDILWKENPGI